MTRTPAALILLLAATPAGAAPTPRDALPHPEYFPTTKGARWVYQSDIAGGVEEIVVTAVELVDGQKVVSRAGVGANKRAYSRMAVSAKGVRRVDGSGGGTEAGDWLLKVPFKPGEAWEAADQSKRKTFGPEKVEVPAGRFEAVRVVIVSPGNPNFDTTLWYAPGIGEVKRVSHAADGSEIVVRALKSFTPGKE